MRDRTCAMCLPFTFCVSWCPDFTERQLVFRGLRLCERRATRVCHKLSLPRFHETRSDFKAHTTGSERRPMEASLEAVVHLPRRLKVWWCRGWDLNPRTSLGFHPSCSPMSYPRLTSRFLAFCKQRAALAALLQKQREWKSVVGLTGLEPVTTSTQLAALPLSYSPCD